MTVTTILIDWRPPYLRGAPECGAELGTTSLLLSPLGARPLLAHFHEQIRAARIGVLTVVPNFEPAPSTGDGCDGVYARALRAVAPEVGVTGAAQFRELVDAHEPSDLLLLLDARYGPAPAFELRDLVREASRGRLATHRVQMRVGGDGIEERVICDEHRRVRAIRRLYDGVTRLEVVGVSGSVLSVAVIQHLDAPHPFCLAELRTHLAAHGVPSRDIPAAGATLDLSEERSFLALNEQWLLKNGHSAGGAALTQLAPGIWIGPGCRIDPTSRIYGPAILHDGVTVETGAAVIGPAVLGQGAHVERGALVSHSVVGARARVVQRTHLVNRVLAPGLRSDAVARSEHEGAVRSSNEAVVRSSTSVVRSLTSHYRSDPSWQPWDWALPALAGLSGNGRARRGGAAGRSSASHYLYAFVKRAFDLVTTLCGLLVLSPLLLLVAALVKLTSPGPVLFGDEREGRGGRVFRCWKFRTMVEGAHAQQRALYQQSVVDGPQFKILADPRTTTLGRFLRATNIDELPQLFNVVRGDMSLIGPRPSPFRENQICVPWREARLSVRPGITGLWQVCRNERPTGDFHQWIYFDTLYVRHRAFWLDLRILAATFLTLGGRWGVPLEWMLPARHLRRWETAVPLAADRAAAPRAASLASGVQL